MSLKTRIRVERAPIDWAQWIATKYHYLHRPVHPRAHPFAYRVWFDGSPIRPDGMPCGMLMFATIHYTRQKGLFGYDEIKFTNCTRQLSGLADPNSAAEIANQLAMTLTDNWTARHLPGLDKWQVLVLSRMWLHDDLPRNSATVVMAKIWRRIQRDWLEHHPPVDSGRPYHIRLIVSWADLDQGHQGTVYKAANFTEVKRTVSQRRHGKSNTRGSGGFNLIQYAYWLREPRWRFEQLRLFET